MNKERRAAIRAIWAQLEILRDQEQEALDNLPESFQESERGEAMQTAVESIDEALSALEAID